MKILSKNTSIIALCFASLTITGCADREKDDTPGRIFLTGKA